MLRTNYDPVSKIWSGNNTVEVYNPNVSVGQLVLNSLLVNPEQIAQISDNNGVKITCGEMYMKSVRVAQNLIKMGFKEGDVIGMVTSNHHDLAPIVFAGLTLGLPLNTLDPTFNEDEIYHFFKETQPKIIICEIHNFEIVQRVSQKLIQPVKLYVFDSEELQELFSETENVLYFVAPDIGDGTKLAAAYICTSGTSGLPKCFGLSHAMFTREFERKVPTSTIIFCSSSLYWLSGWMFLLSGSISGCTRIITTEPFSHLLMLKILSKYKVTFTLITPPNIAELLQMDELHSVDLTSLKQIICGSSMVSVKNLVELKTFVPNAMFIIVYGLSEVCGNVSQQWSLSNLKQNSVGLLANNVKVKIINEYGQQLDVNEIGEICIWRKYNFLGYLGNQVATKELMDSEGWIHSGDIGYFDSDGRLYFVDRKKEILKYNSFQISPSEIENVILENTISVSNVCVIGITDPENGNDLPAAFIIRNQNATELVTETSIKKIVAEKLSDAKQLRGGVYFLKEFPLTISGKILKRELKKIANNFYLKSKY